MLNITLFCEPNGTSDPILNFYDGTQANVEWKTKAGCPLQGDGGSDHDHKDDGGQKPGDDNKNDESTGSGVGWFFLMYVWVRVYAWTS
jgi:hypothetical protein